MEKIAKESPRVTEHEEFATLIIVSIESLKWEK